MTGKILDFNAAKQAKEEKYVSPEEWDDFSDGWQERYLEHQRLRPQRQIDRSGATTKPVEKLKTNQHIFQEIYSGVMDDWHRHAIKNTLNEYIKSKIPAYARGAENADYVNDLNAVAEVEHKLDMKVTLTSPAVTPGNPHGWLVGFHRGTEVFSAPPDMALEGYARALNVVLYLVLERKLKTMER